MTTARFHRGIPLTESTVKCVKCWRIYDYPPTKEDFVCTYCESAVPTREKILQQALKIVTKDRNSDYGSPEDNFRTIADYWNVYLAARATPTRVNALDVANMMILMKMSRTATSPNKLDHYVDMAGYASCAGDCIDGSSRRD